MKKLVLIALGFAFFSSFALADGDDSQQVVDICTLQNVSSGVSQIKITTNNEDDMDASNAIYNLVLLDSNGQTVAGDILDGVQDVNPDSNGNLQTRVFSRAAALAPAGFKSDLTTATLKLSLHQDNGLPGTFQFSGTDTSGHSIKISTSVACQ